MGHLAFQIYLQQFILFFFFCFLSVLDAIFIFTSHAGSKQITRLLAQCDAIDISNSFFFSLCTSLQNTKSINLKNAQRPPFNYQRKLFPHQRSAAGWKLIDLIRKRLSEEITPRHRNRSFGHRRYKNLIIKLVWKQSSRSALWNRLHNIFEFPNQDVKNPMNILNILPHYVTHSVYFLS